MNNDMNNKIPTAAELKSEFDSLVHNGAQHCREAIAVLKSAPEMKQQLLNQGFDPGLLSRLEKAPADATDLTLAMLVLESLEANVPVRPEKIQAAVAMDIREQFSK
jgi:hypothetical protein